MKGQCVETWKVSSKKITHSNLRDEKFINI